MGVVRAWPVAIKGLSIGITSRNMGHEILTRENYKIVDRYNESLIIGMCYNLGCSIHGMINTWPGIGEVVLV